MKILVLNEEEIEHLLDMLLEFPTRYFPLIQRIEKFLKEKIKDDQ